ncbi:hypothetical protein ACFSUS_27580 [Spirosoma soli]|uniref:t-SNARE coiled-coil homology domain-containing protein n=1 Tax=Spirosoma soli TaxID=1770529 RepID=A0ABW5MDH3_9BACT
MYLEERVEQVEQIITDHGRQIESIAKGLADLTSDVRAIRQDMTEGFNKIDGRLDSIDTRLDSIDARLDKSDARFDSIDARLDKSDARFDSIDARLDKSDARFDSVDYRLAEMQQTQLLILKLLTERS